MQISVEHLSANGDINNITYDLNILQFTKHLAFAGMGANRSIYDTFRFAGFLFEFLPFWRHDLSFFSIPEIIMHDPTELGQISNRIGKAFADFLAKNIYHARYTHNYEDAMVQHGHPIKGRRPDLYCDTLTEQFAIEAKGYKKPTVSANEMIGHKSQSREGAIPVHFSVASVSYNLYRSPKVKFHDPVNSNIEYSKDINQKLCSLYYQSILEIIKQLQLKPTDKIKQLPQDFLAYGLPKTSASKSPYIILHKSIVEGNWPNIKKTIAEFRHVGENIYIDVDGVGIGLAQDNPWILQLQDRKRLL